MGDKDWEKVIEVLEILGRFMEMNTCVVKDMKRVQEIAKELKESDG